MITRVIAKNFLSWKELNREITPGVTLIDGWNEDDQTPEGSGKSAILNAVCWTLYGKIPKDANIDDVIKEGEKSCEVEVWFTDGTIIRRTRRPNELSMIQDGKSKKGKDANETQAFIVEYVALSFETFCQTIYFAQNYTKKFITSNQEEKGKILSEVQDLIVFDKAGKEVRSLIKMEEDSLTKMKHSLELLGRDRQITERDITTEELKIRHSFEQQEQRVKNIQDRIAETARLIEQSVQDYNQLKDAASGIFYDENAETDLQKANSELMAEVSVINSEIAGIDRLVIKRSNAEAQGKRYSARYKQLALDRTNTLAFIVNPTKDCPTCGSKLEACDVSHAQKDLTRIDEETASILDTLGMLSAEIDTPIPTKEELNQKLSDIRVRRVTNDSHLALIKTNKDKIYRVKAQLAAIEQNTNVHAQNEVKLKATLEMESRPLFVDSEKVDALKVKLDQINLEANNLDGIIDEKTTHLSRLEDLKAGFKEIKSYVFNSMLNEINGRVQKYLSHLFEVPVSVRFRNEDMKIETDVKYDGVDRGLGLLSGGQFRRVSLAVDLALSDAVTARKGARVGVLILDEYFKDLSESSMEKCLTLLEGRGQPVLLIEHNSIFKNIVNNSVMVRLENGTSSVQI